MRLRTLEVNVYRALRDLKRGFIGAVERNACLCTVAVKDDYGRDWLDDADKLKLLAYSARNEFLAQWMENPTAVPKAAWLEALLVARTTGPGTVFHILRTLVPFLWTSEE